MPNPKPPLGEMGVSRFLAEYWQQKPCLLKQALPGYNPPLDENDIAGLACEELAESRLITGSYPAHDWSVHHGPFDEDQLSGLPSNNWTLLVQDVEKHFPPLRELITRFAFIPSWRMDDIMVSVASPGGSVGPHFDQYDVFLLQASGRRRWQISTQFSPELLAGSELNVLQSFEAEQEWTLEPGDMLYLPPGVAHHGVALELGMTWSIGLRAPSQADLLQSLGEWLAEQNQEGARYQDPDLAQQAPGELRPGEITPQALRRLQQLVSNPFDTLDSMPFVSSTGLSSNPGPQQGQSAAAVFFGQFLSSYRLAHRPAPPLHALERSEFEEIVNAGARLSQNPWTRLTWIEHDGSALLFAAGDMHICSISLAMQLCSNPRQTDSKLTLAPGSEDAQALCALYNQGHIYFENSSATS